MKKNYPKLIFVLIFLTSCSVYMASQKYGTTLEDVAKSKTRNVVTSKDGVIITHTERDPVDNNIIYEDYLVLKPERATGRAVMHGVLDVATLGIWEVVGTPTELTYVDDVYVPVRIYYNENEEIVKIEYLSNGVKK